MPKYGTFKYGRIAKYGAYKLVTYEPSAIGPYVPYKMRLRLTNGNISDYVAMVKEQIKIPSEQNRFRIRANNGEWVYTQQQQTNGEVQRVRIRSIAQDGSVSPWVCGDRGTINQ